MNRKTRPKPERLRQSRPSNAMERRPSRTAKAPGALRRAAKARLNQRPASPWPKTQAGVARLHHELEVHQVELEMQNEELRQTQSQLETALQQYTELYDFAPAGYLTLGPDGTIRQANLAAAGLLGIKRSQLLGRRFGIFVAAEDRAALAGFLARALELKVPEPGGMGLAIESEPPKIVQLRAGVSEDGTECRVVITDITERKRAEEALRKSDLFTRTVLNALTSHIAVVDAQGTILAVNEAWRRFARENGGLDPAAYVGANYLSVCRESLRREQDVLVEATLRGLLDVMSGGQEEFSVEYPCHSPQEQRWFNVRGTRFPGAGPVQVVLAHENITERKQVEEELHQLSARLLRLRDEERRRLARELHDSTVQDLAAVMVNLSFLRTVARRVRPEARQALLDSLSLVDRTAAGLRTLTYLLHPPLLEELGLAGVLRDFTAGFARRSSIRVHLELTPEWRRMPEEIELALFRVIQESLSNIHRHSGSATARIALKQTAVEVRLEVRDAGHGFVLQASESIGPAPALGVGITGMRERLREVGGILEIASSGAGTIVRATLPFARPGSKSPP